MHQMNDDETLIKPIEQVQSDIDNFYEEIKEQQQQTALVLGHQPIRNHHEVFYYEYAQ